jgi:S-adenosylmethionine/arginine decarboxylase-like enzyme
MVGIVGITSRSREEYNMSKPFGYSYYLDMYTCRIGAADDLELHYRFLERVVDKIGMTRMSQPVVMHGPTKNGLEIYPDKAGVSGWVPLIESGIQIHSMEPKRFITLDVYSCNKFDKNIILDYARECFGFEEYEEKFFERGMGYGDIA